MDMSQATLQSTDPNSTCLLDFCDNMRNPVAAHACVPPHSFACAHVNLNNHLELGAVLCTGECAISIHV